jgi:tetratricopeptide (TPR) repeat protein
MNKYNFKMNLLVAVFFIMVCGMSVQGQTLDGAITLQKNEQYDEAEKLFQQLIKAEPGNSKLYFHYGENSLLNYFADTISNSLAATAKEAADLFNKGVTANATDPLNYVGLAKVAFYQGDKAKADEMRAKAKSLLPPYKKVTKIENPQAYAYTLGKLAESYIRFEQVDTSKALPLIREAISIDSKNSEVYIIAGDIYILKNDGSKAIKNYNLAQDWDLKSPTANMKIGSIYVRGRNLMAAIPYYDQAKALNQDYAPAYRELGQLYSMAGRFAESKEYFEKYLQLTKGNIPAKIRYVNALFYAKEYDEVIKTVEDIFAVDDSRTYMNRIAGYSSYEKGNFEAAQKYMEKLFSALQADRLIKKDYIYYARIIVKKNQNYAKLLVAADTDNNNLAQLQERVANAKSPEKEKLTAEIDVLKAKIEKFKTQAAVTENELNKAFDSYEKAITFEGEDAGLISEKAMFLFSNRRYKDAADTWSRLLSKGKDSENDFIQIGKAYYQGKEFDKADEVFNKMVAKYPNNLQGHLWIANNASAKDPELLLGLAKPKFLKVLDIASKDSVKNAQEMFDAMRYLGYSALQSKKYDECEDYYNRMLNLAPGNKDFKIKALSSMSSMYMQTGDFGKATDVNKQILALDPGNESATSSLNYVANIQKSALPKANPNEITGVISDVAGTPIASASVRVKDTACEGWTNAKGEYKFVMPEASSTLVISAKGFKTKEIPVTAKRVYSVSLAR